MIWVSILERKPRETGYYYWKGKSYFGGYSYYCKEKKGFYFEKDVPVNKVSLDDLYWLDEDNKNCLECNRP